MTVVLSNMAVEASTLDPTLPHNPSFRILFALTVLGALQTDISKGHPDSVKAISCVALARGEGLVWTEGSSCPRDVRTQAQSYWVGHQ